MGAATLDISPTSLLWPIIISGAGAGMVFVPLSTIAMGTLKNEQIGNASGLFNLMRNVGGGVGISVVNTLVARHAQIHRAELAKNFGPGNPAFQNAFDATRLAMAQTVGPGLAQARAYGVLDSILDRQSAAYSYVDVFRYPRGGVLYVRDRRVPDEARPRKKRRTRRWRTEIGAYSDPMRIGFIGMGQMGSRMARNLAASGHAVAVYNRSKEKAEALRADVARVAGVSCRRVSGSRDCLHNARGRCGYRRSGLRIGWHRRGTG